MSSTNGRPAPQANTWPLIKRFALYMRPQWRGAALCLGAMLLNAAMLGLFYYLIRNLIAPLVGSQDLHQLLQRMLMLLVVGLAMFFTGALNIYLSNRLAQRVIRDVRDALIAHLHRLSLSYLESHRTGELMSRITNDVVNLQSLMVGQVIHGIRAALELTAMIAVMARLSWQLTCVSFVGVPLIVLAIYHASRKVRRIVAQVQEQLAQASAVLQESLSLMRVIQSFAMEDQEIERYRRFNESVYKRTMRNVRLQAVLTPLIEFIGTTGLLLALLVGGVFITRHELKPADLFAFLLAVPPTAARCKTLSGLQVSFNEAAAVIQRIFEVLDEQPEVREKEDAVALPRLRGEVEFDRVSFSYKTSGEILHQVSFTIVPGQVVALVGPSGAGKTTISNLLLRLYEVTAGAISVDGYDVRDVTLKSLRGQLGIVPQETMLFSGSVRDNITFAKPEATDEEIRKAARRANAHEFIMRLAQGYDTLVGERGAKLSGGQRQRIAIARALLRDPRILILDEATSSLDAESESLVQDALERLMENRTTIVIAHRLSTIRRADRILVLDYGRIAEEGNHRELLAANGLYRKLYDLQTFETATP